jgi:hypothetical protein
VAKAWQTCGERVAREKLAVSSPFLCNEGTVVALTYAIVANCNPALPGRGIAAP